MGGPALAALLGLGDVSRERGQQFRRRPGPTGVAGIHQGRQRRGHQIGLDRGSRGRAGQGEVPLILIFTVWPAVFVSVKTPPA